MGNLLGSPLKPYVNTQVKLRQEIQGRGVSQTRTDIALSYLNSRNAWVKLASAVYIEEDRLELLKKFDNPITIGIGEGYDLAQKNVLFNGLTDFKNNEGKFEILNENLSELQDLNVDSDTRYAYGVGGTDFGFSPMPGITSVNIKDLNRGSIKKTTINIKAHNRNQFDIIDVLYLRLGYTVCLEYGNNIYLSSNSFNSNLEDFDKLNKVEDTLIDKYFWTVNGEEYSEFSKKIEAKRKEYEGNYDGIVGIISNFNWSFDTDGTYNITLEVTSVGDVIESLRVNLPPLVSVATSANAQNKLDEITEDLAKEIANQSQYYKILYPGLKEELKRTYNILTDNGKKSIFNWTLNSFEGGSRFSLNIPNAPETLKIQPQSIQNIKGSQQIIEDSTVSQNSQWFSNLYVGVEGGNNTKENFYLGSLSGGVNLDPLEYSYAENQKVLILIYNKDGTEIISSLNLENNKKPDWIDNQKNDFQKHYPEGGFYVVIGGSRNTLTGEFTLTRRSLAYLTGKVNTESEEYEAGFTKYFSELNNDQKNLAFPIIFPLSSLETFFYTHSNRTKGINIPKGGKADKRFSSSENAEEKSPLETFKNKLETGKYKNKINNWFYNIRIYYDASFLSDDDDDAQKVATTFKLFSLPKITLESGEFKTETEDFTEIGYQLNPLQNSQSWDKSVGFPSSDSNTCDIVKLKITPFENSYFIRLGTLLEFIQEKIIIKINGKFPYLKIDTNPQTNICYVIDNSISSNIKKCLVSNLNFFTGVNSDQPEYEVLFKGLEPFLKGNGDYIWGEIMNIYLNFNRVEEIFDSVDKNNQISLFEVLKSICEDINESLGNVNNIEPVIDKESQTIKLIDQTSIPGLNIISAQLGNEYIDRKKQKELQTPFEVFGYNQNDPINVTSNFIKNVGMTTEISKNYATAITIGATSQGEVPGIESTAFSRWNVGIKDRFKNTLFDAEQKVDSKDLSKDKLKDQNKSVISNYISFISDGYVKLGLNFNGESEISINNNYIGENKNTIKNYYIYAQAKTTEENYKEFGSEGSIESSIGFLPINLKLEMDGISGIRIYDFIKINTSFLPSNYPNTLEFICTGVHHKIENNEWVTSLDTLATSISKTTI